MSYKVRIKRSAIKEFKKLPKQFKIRMTEIFTSLAEEPFPHTARKLQNRKDYRIRVGDYRILYSVNEEDTLIEIIAIGHRKDVYR